MEKKPNLGKEMDNITIVTIDLTGEGVVSILPMANWSSRRRGITKWWAIGGFAPRIDRGCKFC